MAKKKYYVVWEGHEPGIYDTWEECQNQIKNYPGARYKSFKIKEEAEEALYGNSTDYIGKNKKPVTIPDKYSDDINWDSISVDAACSGNPGVMEYRGVDTKTGFEIFRKGPFPKGTNNIGEFLALVHGLALLKKEGRKIPIYSDSRIAIGWVKKKRIGTKLARSSINEQMFQFVERAIKWLKTNEYETEILKWETKEWGEIPADFGRK